MLGTFDLTTFLFAIVNLIFDTASLPFSVINISTVGLFVLEESFDCSNSLS